MVRERQRRRQLARAKWQRQEARRSEQAKRRRTIGIVFGVILAIGAAAGLVWLVLNLTGDDGGSGDPTTPATTSSTPNTDTSDPTDSTTTSGSTEPSGEEVS